MNIVDLARMIQQAKPNEVLVVDNPAQKELGERAAVRMNRTDLKFISKGN